MSTVDSVKTPARTGGGESGSGILAWWHNSRNFLTEVRHEMKRVTWPSRKEVYATTVVVILTSTFFGLYLWGLDLVFTWAVNWVFRQFGGA